jgi:hypothetical protein
MLFLLPLLTLPLAALAQIAYASTVTEIVTITDIVTKTAMLDPTTTNPPPTTLSTSFTNKCDNAFCSEGSRWCFYWGGVSSYDVTLGPIPGETHTILGACTNVTTTYPGSVVTRTLTSHGTASTETTTIPPLVTVVEQW